MKTRILSLLVLIELMAPSAAKAQNWGTGLYGGSQNCAANSMMGGMGQQPQPPANRDSAEVLDLESQLTDLKTEKRDLAKTVNELQRKKQQYSDAISARLSDDWSAQVLSHLDDGGSCSCDPSGPSDGDDAKPDRGGPPGGDRGPGRPGGGPRVSSLKRACSRLPAGETFGASGGNSYDRSWSASSMGTAPMMGGGQCAASEITKSKSWQAVCHKGGVNRLVCTHPHFTQDGREKSPSECLDAVANYAKVSKDLAKAKSRLAQIDSESKDLRQQIKEARADGMNSPGPQEGGGMGPGPGQSNGGGMSTNSLISTLAPLGAGVLGGLGAEYMGYRSNQANNANLTKLGYPTQSYTFGSYGFPFLQSGIYGSLAANQQQNVPQNMQGAGFGCASSMGGGGPTMGAYGMMNPSYRTSSMGGLNGLSAMGGMGLSGISMGANPFTNPYGSYGYTGSSAFSLPVGAAGVAGYAGSAGVNSSQYNSLMYRLNQVNTGAASASGFYAR